MWSFGTTMTIAGDKKPDSAASESQTSPSTPPPQAVHASPESSIVQLPPREKSSVFSQRSLNQLGLFAAGAGFLTLSTIITRRAVGRKLRVTTPQFYNQSNRPVSKIDSDGSLIAVEALGLATLNVIGFGIMLTGGIAWGFDISGIDDLRNMARRQFGPTGGRTDEEAEREVEEWVAKVLLRKEQKEQSTDLTEKSPKTKP